MYLYLYAPFLRHKKYARNLALLEGRVTDFGITGKIAQLSQFLKFPAAIKEFGMKRLKTLVLIGDDDLLEQAVNQFALSQVVLAYIPLVESKYAAALSLPQGVDAAEALAARRIVKLDVGRVENKFFLGSIRCEGKGLELHSPTFSVFPKGQAVIEVFNLREGSYPTDKKLDVQITPFKGGFVKKPDASTVVQVKSCRLKAKKSALVDCGANGTLKTPLQVDIVAGAIRMIVGSKAKLEAKVKGRKVKKRKK